MQNNIPISRPTWSLYINFLTNKIFLLFAYTGTAIMVTIFLLAINKSSSTHLRSINLFLFVGITFSFIFYLLFLSTIIVRRKILFQQIQTYFLTISVCIFICFSIAVFFFVKNFFLDQTEPSWPYWFFLPIVFISMVVNLLTALYLTNFWEKIEKSREKEYQNNKRTIK